MAHGDERLMDTLRIIVVADERSDETDAQAQEAASLRAEADGRQVGEVRYVGNQPPDDVELSFIVAGTKLADPRAVLLYEADELIPKGKTSAGGTWSLTEIPPG